LPYHYDTETATLKGQKQQVKTFKIMLIELVLNQYSQVIQFSFCTSMLNVENESPGIVLRGHVSTLFITKIDSKAKLGVEML